MKTGVDHLPLRKRRDLERMLGVLSDEFRASLARGPEERHRAKILKVILYGSHARGDWVADPKSGYVSDWDILVVVDTEAAADMFGLWGRAEEKMTAAIASRERLEAPVSVIVHTFDYVNDQLRRGRPFFVDVIREGVAVHEREGVPDFDPPQPLNAAGALEEAQDYFETWMESAERFAVNGREDAERKWNNEAAFLLHQATERTYHCILLVLTLYSPHSHNIKFLRNRCEELDARLVDAWPRVQRIDRRRFELLRRAYIEARYSKQYKITSEELTWLAERIAILQTLARQVCHQRLEIMSARAG